MNYDIVSIDIPGYIPSNSRLHDAIIHKRIEKMNTPEKHPTIRSDLHKLETIPKAIKAVVKEPSNVALRLLIAGGISGCITKSSTAPLERVKILLQLHRMKTAVSEVEHTIDKKTDGISTRRPLKAVAASKAASTIPPSSSILGTVRHVLKTEGILSFWKGNGANCVRVVPVYGLKFGLNDHIKDMMRSKPGAKLSTSGQLMAGTMAGCITVTATYPLDVVRTRLALGSGFGVEYKGIFDCAYKTIKFEGFRGLYKGYLTTILTGSPYVGLQMTGYNVIKNKLPTENNDGKSTAPMYKVLAGALAGIFAQTITFPGDTVRRRMQANGVSGGIPTYTGTMHCVSSILRHEGYLGLFSGYSANLIRSMPGMFNLFFDLNTVAI